MVTLAPFLSPKARAYNDIMSTVLLERDMPAAALSEYLASHEATAPLADKLAAAVDGNLLIELIKEAGKADASASTIS